MSQTNHTEQPLLIVTASMGSGHLQTANELARRLSNRMPVHILDILDLLPLRIGNTLRTGYASMIHNTPWLYDLIFQTFFVPRTHWQPSTSPLVTLAARRLHHTVTHTRPRAVVSTFHLAGQAAGRLRQRGLLTAPSVVVITEPATHLLWSHPGTDLFLCPYPWVATDTTQLTGRTALAPGPIIRPGFHPTPDHRHPHTSTDIRRQLGLHPTEHAILVSGGSWGTGKLTDTVHQLAATPQLRPVVLCGHNHQLQTRLAAIPRCIPLGWREDLPTLFTIASALIDNAGGTTCAEAFAAGLPVISHQPLAGHGRAGITALTRAGLLTHAHDHLADVVHQHCTPNPQTRAQRQRAAAVFRDDAAEVLTDWLNTWPTHRPDTGLGTGPAVRVRIPERASH